ncbi:uncharacterized protein LOC128640783 [Bombina bombina]|uniref:uncharacterized protein LOC128640783 n=1 Tax=Bombina bombina TaxID=8345 RepID=UPI00235AB473|nr:uncharacterized protein LOC128640783 [Bombina bombina]
MASAQAGKTKSGRSIMFTHLQNCILVESVIEHYDDIIGYQARTVNPQRKRSIWTEISRSVSAEGSFPKDVWACRKRVTDIRKKIKKKVCREKQCSKGTGGGSGYRAELTDFEQMLYARMGDAVVDYDNIFIFLKFFYIQLCHFNTQIFILLEQEDEGREEEEIDAQEDQPFENEYTSQEQQPSTSTVQREEGASVRALLQTMQDSSILLFEEDHVEINLEPLVEDSVCPEDEDETQIEGNTPEGPTPPNLETPQNIMVNESEEDERQEQLGNQEDVTGRGNEIQNLTDMALGFRNEQSAFFKEMLRLQEERNAILKADAEFKRDYYNTKLEILNRRFSNQ